MSSEAMRGLTLVVAAALVGLLVLGVGFDDPSPTAGSPAPEPIETPAVAPTTEPALQPARPAGQVEVLVANATDTAGFAGNITTQLAGIGYSTLEPTNATITPSDGLTDVHFAAGFEAEAIAVAAALQLPPSQVSALPATAPVADAAGAEVLIVLANDLVPVG